MKWHRIYSIVLRYVFLFRRSFDRLTEAFYWPSIDLLLWGLTSFYFESYAPNASQFLLVIVSGIVFWLIVWRSQYEITVNLLEDIWNKNLINIFVSPLRLSEWMTAFIILGVLKAMVSFSFALFIAYVLYKVQIFFFGFLMLPFAVLLLMTGWWVGFFVAGLILRFGTRVQTFAWTLVMILAPFSAIYYPVSVLPTWAQWIAAAIPTSYVFEGMRQVIFQGYVDPMKLLISFVLNLFYLLLAIWFLKKSFRKILNRGLIKVY